METVLSTGGTDVGMNEARQPAPHPPPLAVTHTGQEQRKNVLGQLAAAHVREPTGFTPCGLFVAEFVQHCAWSTRTYTRINSQSKCYKIFSDDDGRDPLPISEGHLLAFIGWLKSERMAVRRGVATKSVPQYLNAIRTMHRFYIGSPSQQFSFLKIALWAYKKWKEVRFPSSL